MKRTDPLATPELRPGPALGSRDLWEEAHMCDSLRREIDRLRAVNAELVTALRRALRLSGQRRRGSRRSPRGHREGERK